MTGKDFIVAIELGSSKIKGIAGKKNSDGSIQIFAYACEEASTFMRKGIVYNIDKMALSLTSIINKLEAELDASIAKVYVGISGQSLHSKKNFIVHQMDEETKVQRELIDILMENNLHTSYAGMEILDVIPQEYKIKNSFIVDPIGTVTDQIKGQYLNIIARTSIRQNLGTSFKQANIKIADFLVTPIATAEAVLTEAEKRTGCVLVDFGADTTTVSVYHKDILRHLVVLPLGGNNITKDICCLRVEEADAEALKIKYGCAYTHPDDKEMENKYYAVDEKQGISAKTLNEIVEARTEEIIANIQNQINLSGYADKLSAGYILTGGGANLKKLTEAFIQKHRVSKVRIANFVQWEIKATRPELLIKNGMLNALFGLLAAGDENCCEVEPIVSHFAQDLFANSIEEEIEGPDKKEMNERAEQEDMAARIAKDDDFWNQCQDNDEYDKYLEEYPEGRHAAEAQVAVNIAKQEQLKKDDDAFWEECQTNKQWKRYLKNYPDGLHIKEAERRLAEMKRQKKENGFLGKLKKFGEKLLEEE